MSEEIPMPGSWEEAGLFVWQELKRLNDQLVELNKNAHQHFEQIAAQQRIIEEQQRKSLEHERELKELKSRQSFCRADVSSRLTQLETKLAWLLSGAVFLGTFFGGELKGLLKVLFGAVG